MAEIRLGTCDYCQTKGVDVQESPVGKKCAACYESEYEPERFYQNQDEGENADGT